MTTAMSGRITSLCTRICLTGGLALLLLAFGLARPVHADPGADQARRPWVIECIDCPHWFRDLTPQAAQIDSQGAIHVAYGGEQFYHAWQTAGGWQVEVVDALANVGRLAALAIDATDRLHAVYLDDNSHTLRYAVREAGAWHSESPDPTTIFESNPNPTIAVDKQGRPHIAYYHPSDGNLYYLVRTDAGWQKELVDGAGDLHQYVSLAVDGAGNPSIAYSTVVSLRLAVKQNSAWVINDLETNQPGHGNSWANIALAFDAAGRAHIAVVDYGESIFKGDIVYYTGEGATWEQEVIPDACTLPPPVQNSYTVTECGQNLALRLDAAGEPRLAYFNYHVLNDSSSLGVPWLRYAERVGGQWTVERPTVEVTNTQLVLDAVGAPHILGSHNMALAAYAHTASWPATVIDQGGAPGGFTSVAVDYRNRVQVSAYDSGRLEYRYGVREGGDQGNWKFTAFPVLSLGGRSVLALDPAGWPRILYNVYARVQQLRYVIQDASGWHDFPGTVPSVLGYPAAFDQAVDRTGASHIVYTDAADGSVKYMIAGSSRDPTTFPSTIDSSLNVRALAVAVDARLVPRVAYVVPAGGVLRYGTLSGGRWVTTTVASGVQADTNGQWAVALALGPGGAPQIAFADGGALRVAKLFNSQWISETAPSSLGPVAPQVDLAVDSNGRAHLAYYDSTGGDLVYGRWDPEWGLRTTTVDTEGDVGKYPSIALDSYGQPHITYYDATHHDLKHAYIPFTAANFSYLPVVGRQ